jgi:hypothetical protein
MLQMTRRFPALSKKNFFCVQLHQVSLLRRPSVAYADGPSRDTHRLLVSLLLRSRFDARQTLNHAQTLPHAALHYDLRLQVNGGTFSWAIPVSSDRSSTLHSSAL